MLEPLLERGLLISCPVVELELHCSARSAAEHRRVVRERQDAYGWVETTAAVTDLALDLQTRLIAVGQHRGPGPIDLLIAATAIVHDLTVLHHDADFDAIAGVSDLDSRWVVPRGSL